METTITKPNTLEVAGSAPRSITLRTPKGSLPGWTFNGVDAIRHTTGQTMRFSAEVAAEIIAAVQSATTGTREVKTGAEVAAMTDQTGWTFAGTRGDVVGLYTRQTRKAQTVIVGFSKSDLV